MPVFYRPQPSALAKAWQEWEGKAMSHITGNSNDHAMLQAIVFTWRRTQKTHPGATIPTPLELVLLQAEELLK